MEINILNLKKFSDSTPSLNKIRNAEVLLE